MTPYYADDWLTLYGGDCIDVMRTMPSDSVDCVVTSPPYWGLRDYGTATWEGGDVECDHEPNKRGSRFATPVSSKQASNKGSGTASERDCKCGATRIDSQLGIERTPEEYVANMVNVFREVRRVLKPSGTCWLNLGDSYRGSGRGLNGDGTPSDRGDAKQGTNRGTTVGKFGNVVSGLKPKDLVGIPWRVAFALQADGWYFRSDIIWSKPNPMPESVTDRPTKAHEYLFLLTKSARYYYNAAAIRSPPLLTSLDRLAQNVEDQTGSDRVPGKTNGPMKAVRRTDKQRGHSRRHAGFNDRWDSMTRDEQIAGGANARSVWTIATRPYPGAHFAVFPPELPERCIKAGSPEGGLVMDPFGGSGTVGMVANRLSRRAILIDLNPEYLEQQMKRNAQTPLGLSSFGVTDR